MDLRTRLLNMLQHWTELWALYKCEGRSDEAKGLAVAIEQLEKELDK